jgi:NTE family protein
VSTTATGADVTPDLAVVLGAGGPAAWCYHLGVTSALADRGLALGSLPGVIGTSAGAAIAGAVLGGAAPDAVLDATEPPDVDQRRAFLTDLREANRDRSWWPAAPHLIAEALPGGVGLGVAWAGLAPRGVFPPGSLEAFPGLDGHDTWPEMLRVVAVRLDTGDRVVFGARGRDVPVATAVAASQSVPLLFAPTVIDGVAHVDGATRSSTNADLVLDLDVGTVLVVAPMARPGGGPARRLARRALRAEVAALESAGLRVLLLRPGPELDEPIRRVRRGGSARVLAAAGTSDTARLLASAGLA